MPGVVIAGISGSGKTHLHRAVTEAVTASGRELVMTFPQAMTTTAHQHLAVDRANQAFKILHWCEDVISFAERVHAQAVDGGLLLERENYPFNWTPMLLLEGFVFDIPLHDLEIARHQVRDFEERLARLGVLLVVLEVPESQILEQCVRSTRRHRGQGWEEHLERLGSNDQLRAEHFSKQQQQLRQWASGSPLPSVRISTGEQDWQFYTQLIMQSLNELSLSWIDR